MTATRSPSTAHHFAMRFRSTPRGAHLARQLCARRLDEWGIPHGSDAHDTVTLIVSELCANAVRHGHVTGRGFHVLLTADQTTGTVRVEVSDTRGERLPGRPGQAANGADAAEGGRGLLLVEALADRWGCAPRTGGGPGKTVWAEYALGHVPSRGVGDLSERSPHSAPIFAVASASISSCNKCSAT